MSNHAKLVRKFPNKKIDILYITNNSGMQVGSVFERSISDNIKHLDTNYENENTKIASWMIETKVLASILNSRLAVKRNWREKLTDNVLLIGRVNDIKTIFVFPNMNRLIAIKLTVKNRQIEFSIGKNTDVD